MSKLTWLSIDGNSISSLAPVAGLTSLITLNTGYNDIHTVDDVVGLAAVKSLRLDANPISDITPLRTAVFAGRYVYITLTCCPLDENCDPANGPTTQCDVVTALEAGGASIAWGDRSDCGTDPPLLGWPTVKEQCSR